MMKMNRKHITGRSRVRSVLEMALLVPVLLIAAISCEEPAKDIEWGFSLLYMPQAVLQSGGTNNNYFVNIDSTENQDTLIVVGLYRSGLEPVEPVTVELSVDTDTLAYLISRASEPDAPVEFEMYRNAVLLDEKYYSIPETLSLERGDRDSYDYITLKKNLLWTDTAPGDTYFILPLRISNPTRYELNSKLSVTLFTFTREGM